MHTSIITLGGGCFWCLEAVYEQIRGIDSVLSGYANGQVAEPSYEQVCQGHTGHAEVVQLGFDPAVISVREILEVFFVIHDPTTLNRQGHDVGTQYRSGIYYTEASHREIAQEVLAEVNQDLRSKAHGPTVTELQPLQSFWPAEAYHQQYFARHPQQGYCAHVVAPKVAKFRQTFARLIKD